MKFSRNIFGVASFILVACSIFAIPAGAQDLSANAAQGMQISPALVEMNASRGGTYNIKLNVMNVTGSDLSYTSSVADFNSNDETGTPHIVTDNNSPETASIKTWVSIMPPEFVLEPHKSQDITVKITVPYNAEPGGHYGVIRFSGTMPEMQDTGVGLSASAGTLILIRVDGDITEKASLASFYGTKNNDQGSFFESSPITFVTRIQNEGNIHVKPVGDIEVRDMFGGLVANLSVNEDAANVLPSSIRRFETKLDKTWMLGRYTASLTLGYGSTGQAITSTIDFWVIPYRVIIVAILTMATIIFILVRMVKVYNRHIINKAKSKEANKNKNDDKKTKF